MKRRVAYIAITLTAVLLTGFGPLVQSASASDCGSGMSEEDCQALYGNWVNWIMDNGQDDCGAATVGNLTGNDNAQKIFNYFVSRGYTQEQAAGILGNMYVESGYDPLIYEGDDRDHKPPIPGTLGWGLVQWTPPSKIVDYAHSQQFQDNSSISEWLAIQAEFLWKQLAGQAGVNSEKAAGDALKKATTVQEATTAFEELYERPLDPGATIATRIGEAEKILNLYGSSSGGSSSNSTSTSSSCVSGTGSVGQGTGQFTDNKSITWPGVAQMIARAKAITHNSFGVGECETQVENAWLGHAGVYASALIAVGGQAGDWQTQLASGKAHPGDRNVPVGALLFYSSGVPYGHVAIYLGNNMVFSTDVLGDGHAYITDASKLENGPWNLGYLGWSDPYFKGYNNL